MWSRLRSQSSKPQLLTRQLLSQLMTAPQGCNREQAEPATTPLLQGEVQVQVRTQLCCSLPRALRESPTPPQPSFRVTGSWARRLPAGHPGPQLPCKRQYWMACHPRNLSRNRLGTVLASQTQSWVLAGSCHAPPHPAGPFQRRDRKSRNHLLSQ